MRARFAVIWIALTAVVAGIAAYIAYGVGLSTHVPEVAAGGAPPAVYYYHPFFWGFPFFGFFFFLLILFLVFGAFRGRRGWHRGYGPGGHSPMEERLAEWHRKAHEEPPKQS